MHKAPCGGPGTGKSPVDRGKLGWKWSIAAKRNGVPVGWTISGANRPDVTLLADTLASVANAGLLSDIETLHLDRGYDYPVVHQQLLDIAITDACIQRRTSNKPAQPPMRLGMRWIVEATNSWLSNYGQLRRNTDQRTDSPHATLNLATTILITTKLINRKNR